MKRYLEFFFEERKRFVRDLQRTDTKPGLVRLIGLWTQRHFHPLKNLSFALPPKPQFPTPQTLAPLTKVP
jgi:hypothetical protein